MPTFRTPTPTQQKTQTKTDYVAEFFDSQHTLTQSDPTTRLLLLQTNFLLDNLQPATSPTEFTSPVEIHNIIKKSKPFKAYGPDGKDNVQLTDIYNASLKILYFCTAWKEAVVIPILPKKINIHISQQNIIIEKQFSFHKNHNPELQLARIVDKTKISFICWISKKLTTPYGKKASFRNCIKSKLHNPKLPC